jgi:hypothetical protein
MWSEICFVVYKVIYCYMFRLFLKRHHRQCIAQRKIIVNFTLLALYMLFDYINLMYYILCVHLSE